MISKRKLAYLRRYTRVGSILIIFLLPVVLFFVLKTGKYFYKNVPTLYTLENKYCSNIIPENKTVILFVAKNKDELAYSKKIYKKLTEQLKDIQQFIPPLYVVVGTSGKDTEETVFMNDSTFASFVRNCLQSEPSLLSPANVFFIKKNYEVGGVYALHKFTDRKKLKEALTIYLYLLKHPENEAKEQ